MKYDKWRLRTALATSLGLWASVPAQASLSDPLLALDLNDDGVVTMRELEARALERWTKTDVDHDGKVTANEMRASLAEFRHERFAARDADGNGVLEQGELADVPEPIIRRLDVDGSGALSQAELDNGALVGLGSSPGGEPRSLPGDANNDGAITQAEAVAMARMMARIIDSNADGRLSAEELYSAPILRSRDAQLLGL
jgi:Ca2+-binding EF-hand superfamily protein